MAECVRVRVWCEDREHEAFVRALLTTNGVEARNLRFQVAPRGTGAASAWVMQQYHHVRRQARAAKHQTRLGFLVVVDGDNDGIDARRRCLEQVGGIRENTERIAIWIPTWSIETWVLWLSGQQVDESSSLKHNCDRRRFRELLPAAVAAWQPSRENEIASLRAGREELVRLPLR